MQLFKRLVIFKQKKSFLILKFVKTNISIFFRIFDVPKMKILKILKLLFSLFFEAWFLAMILDVYEKVYR